MNYRIRKAVIEDLDCVMNLYAVARQFMRDHDNPDQWGNTYPPEELVRQDITREKQYLVEDATGIHGVFYFAIEEDPTYRVIRKGCWRADGAYGVIHRVAGDGSGGILHAAVAYAGEQICYLRMDTHADNYVMQRALEKQGFCRCGVIQIDDGTLRTAYERIDGVREAQEKDLGQILELYLHLHETALPENSDVLHETWHQILRDKNHHLIVYEKDGKLLSSCVCVLIPNLTRNVRPYAVVENVVTHGAFRGRGYATKCLAYAEKIAKRSGCYKIMLLTGAKDEKTLSFYKSAGYNSSDKTAFIHWLK